MLRHYIKTLYFCIIFICAISYAKANDKILNEFHDFTYAIIEIKINNIVVDDYIDSYDTIYNQFYSLSGLTDALGFDISYDLFSPNAKGWIYNKDNQFLYNGQKQEFIIGDNKFTVKEGKVVHKDNNIYITIDEFARVMDMRHIYQGDKLLLKLFSKQITPVEQRYLLQSKYRSLKKRQSQQQGNIVYEPDIEFGYELISAPILEFNMDMDYTYAKSTVSDDSSNYSSDNGLDGTMESYLRNNFAYMDSELYVNYDSDEHINSKLFSLWRKERDGDLLGILQATTLEVGDLNSRVGDGIGLEIGNQDSDISDNFNETRVIGTSFAGWRVELYANDIFIDAQTVGADGRYTFEDVKLSYNNNHIEIIKYGEHGEIEKEYRRYNLSNNLLKNNKLFYNAQYLKANDYLLGKQDEDEDGDGERADNYYLKLGKRINDFNSIFYERVLEEDSEDANIITWVNAIGGVASFVSFSQDDLTDVTKLEVDSLFEIEELNIKTNFNYQFSQETAGDRHRVEAGFLRFYEKFNYEISTLLQDFSDEFSQTVTLNTGYNFDNCLRLYNNINYQDVNDTSSTGVTLRCVLAQQWISSNLEYDISPNAKLDSVNLTYHNSMLPDITYDLRVTLSQDINDDSEWSVENDLLYRLYKLFRAGLFLDYYDDEAEVVFGLQVNAEGRISFAYNPYSRSKIGVLTNTNTERGVLGIRSFIDENYNNFFDAGDEVIQGLTFNGSGISLAPSDRSGVSYYRGLSKDSIYPVTVNYNDLDNLDISPVQETIRVKIISSKVSYIDYMFVYSGLVDGNLLLENYPLERVRVILRDLDGAEAGEYITEHDGYFYFPNVPTGEYVLEVSETSSNRLEMHKSLSFPVILTKDHLFAEYLQPNLKGKVSQKVRNYFLDPGKLVASADSKRAKPVNIAIFNIQPESKPEDQDIALNPKPDLEEKSTILHPLLQLANEVYEGFSSDRSATRPIPDSVLILGENKDAEGLYEVEVAEAKRKSEVISYMVDFQRTYPQIFLSLGLKIRMEDKATKYQYKLKTDFADDSKAAIEYCQKLANTDIPCLIEKETRIVGNFASKEDLYNYRNKLALEGSLADKEVNIRRHNEKTASEVNNVNAKQSVASKEDVTYLGGVSYELLITSENLLDQSVENFCQKYKKFVECESIYITAHGIKKNKSDLRQSGLSKKTIIDTYDRSIKDNIWYRLTSGEFKTLDQSYDFCNSIGIKDKQCIVYERSLETTLLGQPH